MTFTLLQPLVRVLIVEACDSNRAASCSDFTWMNTTKTTSVFRLRNKIVGTNVGSQFATHRKKPKIGLFGS